jgi:hypothetical protein
MQTTIEIICELTVAAIVIFAVWILSIAVGG